MKIASVVTIILILMITLLPACSCGEQGEAATEDNSESAKILADKFSPIIYLKDDEPRENFGPTRVETLIDQADIHNTENTAFTQNATIPLMETYSGSNYYLDIPDISLGILGISPAALKEAILQYITNYPSAGVNPTVYARVTQPGDSNPTVVQYWLFYYFDEWSNFHEGDWELVELVFPPDLTAEELVKKDIQPDFAAYSQHQAGQKLDWEETQKKGTHPVVYVSHGSHANYFTPGDYFLIAGWDNTGSKWKEIEKYEIIMISEEDPNNKEKRWLDFQGGWGEQVGLTISWSELKWTQSGPSGPSWSKAWLQPYQWANTMAPYPKVYFITFLPQLAKIWPFLAIFSIFSPADIYVYDGNGNKAGLNERGEFETQIPGAEYITPEGPEGHVCKTIIIPNGDVSQNYSLIIKGTGVGTMDIKTQVPDAANKVKRYLEYRDIPVTPTTRARLQFTETPFTPPSDNSESVRDDITILEIDQNNNGNYESKVEPGDSIIKVVTPKDLSHEHTLTLLVEGAGVTVPMGSGTYKENDIAIITAEPEKGWVFDRWGGDYSGTSPSIKVVMDSDKTIIAVFKPGPRQFSLTIHVEGKGITSSGPGTYFFAEGSQVSIQALLESMTEKGWVFDHWGGDASGTSPSLSVVMDSDKIIVAYFKPEVRQFSLTIGVEGKGATIPGPGKYFFAEGSKVSISAIPEPGYEFVRWSNDYGSDQTLNLVISSDIGVTATFRQILVIDQSNEPPWEGGWMNIAPENEVGQSIVTRSPVLLAVDVNIVTGNTGKGGDNITMKILYNDDNILASISQFVPEGFDGWLRFEMPKGGIGVPVGATLIIQLEDTGKIVFGWKYAGDTYPSGSMFFFGQAQKGDFFFRTYSTAPK